MDKRERNFENEWREALIKIDELESHLDFVLKEKSNKEKEISEQNKIIQQLRDNIYKSVEMSEYEIMRNRFEKCSKDLIDSQNNNKLLIKKLKTESEEIELLYNKNETQLKDINKLNKYLKKLKTKVEKQNKIIAKMFDIQESRDYYKKELEKAVIEMSELHEFVNICREEHLKQNESNISIDDFNQSITKFWDSLNSNTTGESMDCVIDIKLCDVEKALEEKMKLNEELENRIIAMKEETNQLIELRKEFETKVQDMKTHCIERQQNRNQIKEKESFEKIFNFFESRFLSYIPLNGYLVPFGKRLLFALTPKFVLRLL